MQVIYGGANAFDALLYGEQSQQNIDFMRQGFDAYLQQASQFGTQFMAAAQRNYDSLMSSDALRLARAAINKAQGVFQHDVVRYLGTVEEFQVATPVMQTYVMAHPVVRQQFFDQRIEGYEGTYVDTEPGCIGESHSVWRRVMDSQLVEHTFEGEECMAIISYCEDIEGEPQLDAMQQGMIRASWAEIDRHHDPERRKSSMQALRDLTSSWDNPL